MIKVSMHNGRTCYINEAEIQAVASCQNNISIIYLNGGSSIETIHHVKILIHILARLVPGHNWSNCVDAEYYQYDITTGKIQDDDDR